MNSLYNMRKFFINGLKNFKTNYSRSQAPSTTNSKSNIQVVNNPTNKRKTNINYLIINFSAYKINPEIARGVDYFEKYSKHKFLLSIYDLQPMLAHVWVSPNATLGKMANINTYHSWRSIPSRFRFCLA